MAKSEDLTLNVKVKGANAVDDLADSFEKVETASKDAGRDIDQLISKVNKLGSGKAADLLLTHNFGEINNEIADLIFKLDSLDAEDPEVDVTVARLTELQGDLDTVTSKLKELNAAEATIDVKADTTQATAGMAKARTEIDAIPRSAGGANSALANMYGNVAGEAGTVFGAIGPVNVAIGQMAEYAADAKFAGEGLGSALGSMAKVAGPVAALSLGLKVVSDVMEGIKVREAFEAGLVEDFTGALREAETVASSIFETVRETGELDFATSGGFLGVGTAIEDLLPTLDNLNIGVAEFIRLTEQIDLTTLPTDSQGIIDLDEAIKMLGLDADASGEDVDNLLMAIQQYAAGTADAEEAQRRINDVLSITPELARDATEAWIAAQDPISQFPDEFNRISAALEQGLIPAASDLETVSEGLSIGLDEVLDIAGDMPPAFDSATATLKRQIPVLGAIGDAYREAGIDLEEFERRQSGAVGESTVQSLSEITRALAELRNEQAETESGWNRIFELQYTGATRTQEYVDLWNELKGVMDPEEFAAIYDEKYNDFLAEQAELLDADAQAMREAAAAALETAEAMADLGDTIAEIDTDDIANLSGALESEFNKVDDIFAGLKFDVDFQPALNEALDGLDSFGPDLQTLADEWANILEGKPIDIFGNVRADDAEFQEKMAGLTNLFQEGVVNAFDQGGVAAANTFVQSTAAQIAASTGLDIAEVYRIMGLPPDGAVDAIVKPQVDAEAAADAAAILNALQGVDPNNPIYAYLQLALQTGDIPPQIAEIASKILAGQALGIPANLEGVAQADIEAALAWLAGYGITVEVDADPGAAEETVDGFRRDTERADPAVVDVDADPSAAETTTTAFTSKPRTAGINLSILQLLIAEALLNAVARERTATITADAETAAAERELTYLARRRDAYVYTHTVNVGGGGSRGGSGPTLNPVMMPVGAAPMAMTTAEGGVGISTLTAPAPMSISPVTMALPAAAAPATTNNFNTTIQAGMIGNRNEMDRMVSKALRRHTRLNGSRN